MKALILIFFTLISFNSFSQTIIPIDKNIDTYINWIDSVEQLEFKHQLKELRNRIILDIIPIDTVFYDGNVTIKIHYEAKFKPNSIIIFDNYTVLIEPLKKKSINYIVNNLTEDKISDLDIFKGDYASSIWGAAAGYGIFSLKTKYNSENELIKTNDYIFSTKRAEFKKRFKFKIKSLSEKEIKIFLDNPFFDSSEEIFSGKISGEKKFKVKIKQNKCAFVILRIESGNFTKKIFIRRKN